MNRRGIRPGGSGQSGAAPAVHPVAPVRQKETKLRAAARFFFTKIL